MGGQESVGITAATDGTAAVPGRGRPLWRLPPPRDAGQVLIHSNGWAIAGWGWSQQQAQPRGPHTMKLQEATRFDAKAAGERIQT